MTRLPWSGSRRTCGRTAAGARCGYGRACEHKHLGMQRSHYERKKHFGVKIGTETVRPKISYRTWAMATYLLATRPKGVSCVHLGQNLGMSRRAVRLPPHGPRESWRTIVHRREQAYNCLANHARANHNGANNGNAECVRGWGHQQGRIALGPDGARNAREPYARHALDMAGRHAAKFDKKLAGAAPNPFTFNPVLL